MCRPTQAFVLVLLALVAAGGAAFPADNRTEIHLPSNFDMQVLQFPADRKHLLIWIPSEYGIRPGNGPFARTVQNEGIDYWLIDLHESYLAPTGRDGFEEFEPQHVKELIGHAVQQGWQRIFLGGESRGAALAMQAARQWQIENPGNAALKGLLFFHPFLIAGDTAIGQPARFLPIARTTNLPTYVFQPELNSKFLHSRDLIEQLQAGGATVYFHFLEGVRGGFHVRDADRLYPRETEERERLGQRIHQAIDLLAELPTPAGPAIAAHDVAVEHTPTPEGEGALVPFDGIEPPALRLHDDRGQLVDLRDLEGQVVLINFWATWCGPCVKEIDSLVRLIEEFEDRPFRVLTVNISERKAHVMEFFDTLGVTPNFQVLFDPDGEAARAWRVYAVPSNYLLDRRQRIRYGYRGALKWDRHDVVETIHGLLD